jgi:2-(1,2-epoxy-1,2-dihydrophenyl)acetyl-CoA isomerase
MKDKSEFDIAYESFQAALQEDIASLRFNRDFLLRTTDLENRDRVLDYLDRIGRSRKVKILIVAGAPDSKGREEFIDFFKRARAGGADMIQTHRMYNVINQLVMKVVRLDKFVIYVNSGFVITPYLNMGLACDYRILADNAVIQNPCIELGMAPKGGGGYFLPRMLGRRRAYDIMLSSRNMLATEALDLGLVDEVVSFEKLEETAFQRARDFAAKPAHVLSGVKQLINFNFKDLQEYMEHENEVLLQIIRRNDYQPWLD